MALAQGDIHFTFNQKVSVQTNLLKFGLLKGFGVGIFCHKHKMEKKKKNREQATHLNGIDDVASPLDKAALTKTTN